MDFYFVLLFIFCLDQFTKLLALQYLAERGSIEIFPFLYFTLVHNTGIAFGVFRQYPAILLILISLSLAGLLIWGIRKTDMSRLQRLALAMILGGALGNWADRLRLGAVIDFIDFRIWPVFNIADSAISIGVLILAWFFLKKKSV